MGDHAAEAGMLDVAADDWYHARCVCGWTEGPLPDVETAVDAMVSHAFEQGWLAGATYEREDGAPSEVAHPKVAQKGSRRHG